MTRSPKKTRRVAQVTANYYPKAGGVETHVQEVGVRLAERDWSMKVVTTPHTEGLPKTDSYAGVPIRRRRRWPRSRDWCFAPGVMIDLFKTDIDLVHIQGVHTFLAPMAMIAARLTGKPYIVTFHTGGHSSAGRSRIRSAQWQVLRPLLRRAAKLIAVCEWEIEMFSKSLGVPPERFALIRNGAEIPEPVDGDTCSWASPDELLVVSVGRLERYKGHQRVVAAMQPLVEDRLARLVIVGAGPYEAELRDQIAALGLTERVSIEFFGPERRSELSGLLRRADVMALLSEYEAHPVAVMEALALGCPVLVAETSGLAELSRAGWTRSIELDADPAAVADAIEDAAASSVPEVEFQTWGRCADQIETIYDEVLGRFGFDAVQTGSEEAKVPQMAAVGKR